MSASAIGSFTAYNGAADAIRRPSPHVSSGREAIRPVAAANRPQAEARGRDTGVIIDLRPDPPEDRARGTVRRDFERAGQSSPPRSVETTALGEGAEFTYRANPDTPFRRRTSEQTYQDVESADAPVSHRGGIFDLRI